ncbi:uncharacterized protein RSE6_00331 [Rhynchosporium secalis]|uniref:Centromere protein X n=1 Tax=Rhynchosporium secalis TaxID=38038 RepID=A0A1E1LV41_RHYSE|nr:uncharacterized protein RSE6_00331 [Rhynchosporium secalis]
MPPKPFNPPRPSTAAAGAKPRGRPKGSSNNPTKRKSTGPIDKPSASKSKSKPGSKGKEKANDADVSRGSGLNRSRVSNASTVLNISSEDEDEQDDAESDVEMGSGGEGEGVRDGDSDDPFSSQPLPAARRKSATIANHKARAPGADNDADGDGDVEETNQAGGRQMSIPPDLINVLLHGFFNQDNTRMTKDANAAVGMYIETFIREALNRAAWAKRHGWEDGGVDGNRDLQGGDGEYLEVEDLERLAPQLLLDF